MKGTQFMRNDIETREIADTELDSVSGGMGVTLQGAAGPVSGGAQVDVNGVSLPVGLDTVTSALPQVPGLGTVTGLAGL
jgi:hypothetical protein